MCHDGSCSKKCTSRPSQRPSSDSQRPTIPQSGEITPFPVTSSPITSPTQSPSANLSYSPSLIPTISPTKYPSKSPSTFSNISPSVNPTVAPSRSPSASPSKSPSDLHTCPEPSPGFCVNGYWDCELCKCVCDPGHCLLSDGTCCLCQNIFGGEMNAEEHPIFT